MSDKSQSPYKAQLDFGGKILPGLLHIKPMKGTSGFKGQWKWAFVHWDQAAEHETFIRLQRGGFSVPLAALDDACEYGLKICIGSEV